MRTPLEAPRLRLGRGAILAAALLAACGDAADPSSDTRTGPSGSFEQDGGAAPPAATAGAAAAAGTTAPPAQAGAAATDAAVPSPTPASACVVGSRATGCCPEFEARPRDEAEADACWFEYPGIQGPDESERFLDCSGPLIDCGSVQCEAREPPSRLAGLVTPSPEPSCTFADECTDGLDCVLAIDASAPCPCPVSTPARLLALQPCQLEVGTPLSEAPEVCDRARFGQISCQPCPPLTAGTPACIMTVPGSPRRCM